MRKMNQTGVSRPGAAILPSAVVVMLWMLATSAWAQCGDPCFESTDDILGVQTVAPADDIVGLSGLKGSTPTYQSAVWTTNGCDGSNCEVASVVLTDIVSNGCGLSWRNSSDPGLDRYPVVFEVGRLFELRNDVIATVAPSSGATGDPCGGGNNLELTVRDPQDSSHDSQVTFAQSAEFLQLAKGDANLDGYDDLIFFTEGGIVAITAADPKDPSQGMTFGPVLATTSGNLSQFPLPVTQPTTGDLNSDGLLDVAWVGTHPPGGDGQDRVFVATVCPGPVGNTICADAQPLEIRLGSTIIPVPKSSWATEYTIPIPVNRAIIGDFDAGLAGDELAVFYLTAGNGVSLDMYTVLSDDASLVPNLAVSKVEGLISLGVDTFLYNFHATAAPLSFNTTQTDDLIYSVSWQNTTGGDGVPIEEQTKIQVFVVTFADGLQQKPIVTGSTATTYGSGLFFPEVWFGGHAAGRFAGIDSTTTNLDLQIALVVETDLQVWQLEGTDTSRSLKMVYSAAPGVTGAWPFTIYLQGAPFIRAGDIQGRSLRLGSPDVVRIEQHDQPAIIVNAPPTHVDYIAPSGGDAPVALNLSAVKGYASEISLSSTGSQTASQQSTTSYTYSTKTTESQTGAITKVAYPTQAVNSSFGFNSGHKNAVSKTYTNTQSATNSAFESRQMDISSASSFDDLIWYESYAFNIYHYPVLGVYGCPDSDTCADADKVPLYLTVSGPDTLTLNVGVPAHSVEWFQPIHEVGNILSYPQTPERLDTRLGSRVVSLTAPTTFNVAPDVSTTESVQWQTNTGAAQTSGTTNTQSIDKQSSYSLNVASSTGGEKVDTSKSTSWSTLNTSSTELAESTGIDIISPGTFRGPSGTYDYEVSPGIYGYSQPMGSAQQLELDVEVPSYGPLTVDYYVALTGDWWTGDNDYTQYPDLALNHPERWSLDSTGSSGAGSSDPNCLLQSGNGTALSCADFNQPDTNETDPWMSDFLDMKGFFITTEADQGEGPLVTQITDGDGLFLEVRVYNYSLAPLPAGSETHVRFYAQEWCTSTACGGVNVPFPGVPSVLVEDVLATNPPAVDPTGVNDNWVTASTVFDTTGLSGKTFVFWVVVYALGGDTLVGELPEHGINAVPGDSISIDQANWLLGITESYGNNVGLFHWPVTVESAATAATPPAPNLTAGEPTVTPGPNSEYVIEVQLRATVGVHRGEFITISALGPVGGRRIIDIERTPHFRAGERGGIRVPFRPQTCGNYQLSVSSRRLDALRPLEFNVPCDVTVDALWLPPSPLQPRKGRSHSPTSDSFERVALLGSSELRVRNILLDSLQAGPGAAAPWRALSLERVNYDRHVDLVLTFRSEDLKLTPEDPELCVTGSTVDGQRFATCLDRGQLAQQDRKSRYHD